MSGRDKVTGVMVRFVFLEAISPIPYQNSTGFSHCAGVKKGKGNINQSKIDYYLQ